MKDEFGGVIVDKFVRLKSKMYSIKKLMVKNQILQHNLMNLKMFCLIKKLLDISEKNSS